MEKKHHAILEATFYSRLETREKRLNYRRDKFESMRNVEFESMRGVKFERLSQLPELKKALDGFNNLENNLAAVTKSYGSGTTLKIEEKTLLPEKQMTVAEETNAQKNVSWCRLLEKRLKYAW